MSLTVAELRDDLLGYLGVEDVEHVPSSVRRRIVSDLNGALQEVYTQGPSFLRSKSFTEVLYDPRGLMGKTFTRGSEVMGGGDEVEEDMIGCRFRISGESEDNVVVSQTVLQNPYLGETTSSGSGVVYGDCVVLSDEIMGVCGPVWLNGEEELRPLEGRFELNRLSLGGSLEVGRPRYYWIEAYYPMQWWLRVYPLPKVKYLLRFDAEVKAPSLSFEDVWGSAASYESDLTWGEF